MFALFPQFFLSIALKYLSKYSKSDVLCTETWNFSSKMKLAGGVERGTHESNDWYSWEVVIDSCLPYFRNFFFPSHSNIFKILKVRYVVYGKSYFFLWNVIGRRCLEKSLRIQRLDFMRTVHLDRFNLFWGISLSIAYEYSSKCSKSERYDVRKIAFSVKMWLAVGVWMVTHESNDLL